MRPVMFGPNIQGDANWASGTTSGGQGHGALSFSTSGTSLAEFGGSGKGDVFIYLNASSSNSVYNGSTVQPSALQALPCIRF